MLRNIPISELVKHLLILQRKSPFCNIDISSTGEVIKITPVLIDNPVRGNVKIEIPIDPNLKLKSDDLDKFIV